MAVFNPETFLLLAVEKRKWNLKKMCQQPVDTCGNITITFYVQCVRK